MSRADNAACSITFGARMTYTPMGPPRPPRDPVRQRTKAHNMMAARASTAPIRRFSWENEDED